MRARFVTGVLTAIAALMVGIAKAEEKAAFAPVESDTLTVATVFPAPGVMEGDTPDTLKGGVEWALAKELGLSRVKFVETNFAALISGQVTGDDIAAASIITLPKRTEDNNYTYCYYTSWNAALIRSNVSLDTIEDAKKIKWGVLTGRPKNLT